MSLIFADAKYPCGPLISEPDSFFLVYVESHPRIILAGVHERLDDRKTRETYNVNVSFQAVFEDVVFGAGSGET